MRQMGGWQMWAVSEWLAVGGAKLVMEMQKVCLRSVRGSWRHHLANFYKLYKI